jgi:uncharacterized membrane protein
MGIGFSVLRPYLLGLLVLLPILFLAWRLNPPPLRPRRSQMSLALRLVLVTLLVLTLAGVRVTTQPHQRAVVAVVDLSASARDSQDAEAAAVRSLAASRGPDDLFGVVTFGHDAAVELPPTKDPFFDVFQTQPDPNYTDIASALRLAAGLIPDGYARQLVLISDGRQNLGDGAATVAALRAEGVRVDVLSVGGPSPPEAMILSTEAPAEMRAGQTASVTVRLRSTQAAGGQLALQVDGNEVAARDVTLPAGVSSQTFNIPALDPGLHRVRAELVAKPDTYAQNNVGEAAIRVLGRPYILVLEGSAGEGSNFEQALTAAGMKVDRRPAAQAPTDAAVLGRYDSLVVVDASADQFPPTAMAGIAESVKSLGKGLVAVGGPNAYGPGGWQNTPLEQALPVRMDLPNRKEKPKVAVVLVMETMEDPRADQVAVGAAEAVIDKLTADDEVGVTDGSKGFVVPLQAVKDKKAIDAQLESAALGDPPTYTPFIQMAGDALKKSNAPLKHVVVLGDGDAELGGAGQDNIQSVLEGLKQSDITTSTIGVDTHNQPQFMAYMQDIARWGGGRFYESNDPSQVPQLFLKESQVALRPWFEQDPFFPKVTAGGDLLQGVPLDAFPQLGGYVVTTAKPAAEVYFSSPKQDPVLAAGSYGLGRSVAWTSDSTGHWTAGFLRSAVSGALFARMVEWTLPGGGPENLTVDARPSGDAIQLSVSGPASDGTLSVGVLDPELYGSSAQLTAVGSGKWQGQIAASSIGTYDLHTVLSKGGQVLGSVDTAVVVPYSPEYLDLGRDDAFLRGIAQEGGALLTKPAAAWAQATLPVPISTDVFWLLLLVVAVLWPLDVAMRRLTLTPRQLGSLARAIVERRRPAEVEVVVPELARLRGRVTGVRRRRAMAAPRSVLTGPAEARGIEAGAADLGPPKPGVEEEALSARLLEARRKRRGKGD